MRDLRIAAFSLIVVLGAFARAAPAATSSTPAEKTRPPVHWTILARHVGESEKARDVAVRELKRIPKLDRVLLAALSGPNRPFALDVISALHMDSFIPELLKRAETDEDGFLILTLSSLMTAGNKGGILEAYERALAPGALIGRSPAAIVAMLEPLGRIGWALPPDTLAALFAHDWPEVRSAALYYVRLSALQHRRSEGLPYVARALKEKTFQLRVQAIFLERELVKDASFRARPEVAALRAQLAAACESETNSFVKAVCREGSARLPSSAAALSPEGVAETVAETKEPSTAENSPEDISCQDAYRGLFARGVVSMRVVFGYKDARPARFVGDRHERLAFVQRLLSPCLFQHDAACGFHRDAENSDLFLKDLPPRPFFAGKAQARVVAVASSVGSDDALNRVDPFQTWKSDFAEKAFLTGLARADVALYDGHSRFGGGPDFRPPKLNAAGDVDPAAYLRDRDGLQKIRQTLRKRGAKAKRAGELRLLGLFSCASSQHFSEEIAFDSKTGLVSSHALVYWSDALENSISTISALLDMRCEKDFRQAIRHDAARSASKLDGFFKRAK